MTVSENCTIFLFLGSMNIEQLMNNNQTQLFVFALCSKILYFIFTMIFVLVHYSLPEIALDKVEEMEIRLDEINRNPSDTTVVIINNYISK